MSEQIYLDADNVRVTSTRLIIEGTTYYLRNVTSASVTDRPASWANDRGVFVMGLGGIVAFFGCIAWSVSGPGVGSIWIASAVALALVGWKIRKRSQGSYVLLVATAGSDVQALVSDDPRELQAVLDAMNRAIAGEEPALPQPKIAVQPPAPQLVSVTCSCCGHKFDSAPASKHLCPRCRTAVRAG